jgi:predicted Fe-S protein YdhL (DUF1289 family)
MHDKRTFEKPCSGNCKVHSMSCKGCIRIGNDNSRGLNMPGRGTEMKYLPKGSLFL